MRWIKRWVVKVVFWILGRALRKAHRIDPDIAYYYSKVPSPLSFSFKVETTGPCLTVYREGEKVSYKTNCEENTAIQFIFKNLEAAFMVFTASTSTIRAYAENRVSVKGDIGDVMYIMRILDRVQVYLFPRFIAERVVKRYPEISPFKLLKNRLRLILSLFFC
ncbi:MAG: hypothetical protein ABIM30_06230 [candidate division WOR-3 bacterium]